MNRENTRRSWGQFLLNWSSSIVFPATCAGCGVTDTWLCTHCQDGIRSIDQDHICGRCGLPSASPVHQCYRCRGWPRYLESVRSAFLYEGSVRKAIHLTKFNGQFRRADWFGRELAPLVDVSSWEPHFMTSVPLAPGRERERGFNQSAKIAESLSRYSQVPYRDVVLKVRETKAQTGLNRAERFTNVTGSFQARGSYRGQRIVIVDDVVTTGATLLACAEALRASGASSVFGITVATGTLNDSY